MEKSNLITELNHVLAADNAMLRPSLAPNSSRESSTIGLTNESITDADGASGNFYRINLQTSSADTRTKEDPSQQSAVTRDRFLDFEDVSHIIEFDASSSKPESASAPSLALNDQTPSLFLVVQPELRKLQVQITEQEMQLKQMEEQTTALKKENESLKTQNQLQQAYNEEILGIINKLRRELSVSEKKRDIIMKENISLKRDVLGMKQIIDSKQHETEFNKLMNKNNVMQQQMEKIKESYENKISGYMNLIDDLNSQILRIENQLQQQQRQSLHSFQALKDQNQTLEGQIAQLQQQNSANSSVNKFNESFSLSSKPQSPKKTKKSPESSLNFLKQQILLSQSLIKSKVTQQQQKSKSNKQTQQQFLNQTLPLPNNLTLSPINDSNQKPCPSPLTDQYLNFILSNSLDKAQNLQEQKPLATSKKIINKNGQNKRSQSQQSQRSRSPISEFEDTQKLNMRNYDLNQQRNSMAQTLGRLDFEKILHKKTKRSTQNVPSQTNAFSILQGKSPLNVPRTSKSFDKTSIKDIFLSNVHPRNSSALSSLSDAHSNSLQGKTPSLDTRKMSQGSNEQRFNQTMGPKLNETNNLVSPSPQIKWLPAQIPKQIIQSFEDTQRSIASSEFQISHDHAQKSLNGSLNSTLQFPLEVFSSSMKNSKPPKRSSSRNESSLNSSLNAAPSSQGTKQQLTDANLFSMLTSCKNSGSCASSTRSSTDQYSTHHSSSFSTQKVLDQLAKFGDPSIPKKQNLNKSLQHSQNKTHQISYEEAPQSQMIDQQLVYVNQNPSILNYLGNAGTSNQLQSHFDMHQKYPNFLQNPDDSNPTNNTKTNLNRTTVFSPLSSIQGDFLTLDDQTQSFKKIPISATKNSSQSRVSSAKPTNVPKVPKTKSNTASYNSNIANKYQPSKIMSVDDFCFSDVLSSKTRSNYDNTPLSQSSNACSTASSALTQHPKPQIKLQSKQQFSKSQRKASTSNNKPPYSGMIYDQQPYQQSFSFYEGSEMENSQSYCDVTNYLENHAMEANNSQSFEKEISQKNQAIANLSQAHFRSRSEQAQYKNNSGGSSKSSSRNGQNNNQTNKVNSLNNSNKQSAKNSRNSNLKEF